MGSYHLSSTVFQQKNVVLGFLRSTVGMFLCFSKSCLYPLYFSFKSHDTRREARGTIWGSQRTNRPFPHSNSVRKNKRTTAGFGWTFFLIFSSTLTSTRGPCSLECGKRLYNITRGNNNGYWGSFLLYSASVLTNEDLLVLARNLNTYTLWSLLKQSRPDVTHAIGSVLPKVKFLLQCNIAFQILLEKAADALSQALVKVQFANTQILRRGSQDSIQGDTDHCIVWLRGMHYLM